MTYQIEKHPDISLHRAALLDHAYFDCYSHLPFLPDYELLKNAASDKWRNAFPLAWAEPFIDSLIIQCAGGLVAKSGLTAVRNALIYGHTRDGWEIDTGTNGELTRLVRQPLRLDQKQKYMDIHAEVLPSFLRALTHIPALAERADAFSQMLKDYRTGPMLFTNRDTSAILADLQVVTSQLQNKDSDFPNVLSFLTAAHRIMKKTVPARTCLDYDAELYLRLGDALAANSSDFSPSDFDRKLLNLVLSTIRAGNINLIREWLALAAQLCTALETSCDSLSHVLPLEQLHSHIRIALSESPPRQNGVVRSSDGIGANARDELSSLIGLESAKAKVSELVALVRINQLRQMHGLETLEVGQNLIFVGPSGTGKTTVARLLARIYKEIGFLTSGHLVEVDRKHLVGQYVGATAITTAQVFDQARGGVLFVDEAYALASADNFGREAISTLMKMMEDNRQDIVVIVAGYPEPMKDFLDSNPGFRSRFSQTVTFVPYDNPALWSIFEQMAQKLHYVLPPEFQERFNALIPTKKEDSFGNGRFVRNIFEKTATNQAKRVAALDGAITLDDLCRLDIADLPLLADLSDSPKRSIGFNHA